MSKKRSRVAMMTAGAGYESDSGSDSAGEAAEELVAAGLVKPSIAQGRGQYDKGRLLQALDDIKRKLPWVESLDVSMGGAVELENPDDDLKREVAFYNLALASVKVARAKLDTLGEAHRRPDDYFAEMLKTDTHMQRVKDKLIFEQKKMAAVEQRKREKEQRQYAKQVQAERTRDKNTAKRASQAALKSLVKRKGSRGGMLEDSEVEAVINGRGAGRGGEQKGKRNWKRDRKNEKYGSGGKKRGDKRNDKASSAQSYKDFNHGNRSASGGPAGRRGKGKANRPGKRRRLAARAGRS